MSLGYTPYSKSLFAFIAARAHYEQTNPTKEHQMNSLLAKLRTLAAELNQSQRALLDVRDVTSAGHEPRA
jgi:hypothetical protein